MLDLGRSAWVIKELVANTKADNVMPKASVLKALLAMYLITALYRPVRANIIRVVSVVDSIVMEVCEVIDIASSPCLSARAL